MSISFRGDLHCHSTFSDGSETPEELVDEALSIGLQGLAITDHDTVEAYAHALPHCEGTDLRLLSGVEFSTTYEEISVHVLAYSFAPDNALIRHLCDEHVMAREDRNSKILALLRKNSGINISEEELHTVKVQGATKAPKSLGRPHIAQLLVNKGHCRDIQDAFRRFIGDNGPCYEAGVRHSTEECIDIIHQAGGVAVIAHPHLIRQKHIVKDLLEMDFDGIECYYARFPRAKSNRWIQVADEKGWFKTGGSDYHGSIKPNLSLGCSWVGRALFDELYSIMQDNISSSKKNEL